MIPLAFGLLLVASLPWALVVLKERPRAMCGVALAGCLLPFFLPTWAPLWRTIAAIATSMFFIKALVFAAGHVRPRGTIDFIFFMITMLPVVRWDTPHRPDLRRAGLTFLTALFQFGLVGLLILANPRLDAHSPLHLVATPLGLYLLVSGLCNLTLVKFSLRGLDYVDGFNHPFGSRTLGEFWSQRWNIAVSHLLHRYVFLPAGGLRHPVRGIFAAFAASGVYHEAVFDLGARKFNGGMLGFFTLHGALVAVTARSRFMRRLARDVPLLAWFLTTVILLVTGLLFVRGMDGVDPTNAWRRVFGSR